MMRRIASVVALAIGLLVTPGTAAGQALNLQVRNKVLAGGGQKPALIVGAAEDLKNVTVNLMRNGQRVTPAKLGNLRAGQQKEVPLDQPIGHGFWRAEIRYAGAAQPEEIEFEVTVARELKLAISRDTVDLAEGRISFRASEHVVRVTVTVVGEGGTLLGDYDLAVDSPAESVTTVNIPPATVPVTLVRLTAYDVDGFYNGIEMAPFSIDVPHEEVAFEFGKADILPGEEAKLTRTLANIREALKKVGNEFKAKLYVAGYTDTVGSPESNRDLSDRRAHAIARWFVQHGLHVKVCSQGFGEDALAVATPDETAEARNRRTIHVLANQTPPISRTFPRGDWRCL